MKNINDLFKLFDTDNNQDSKKEKNSKHKVITLDKDPTFRLNSFIKRFSNFSNYKLNLISLFKDKYTDEEITFLTIEGISSKGWEDISYIDINDPTHHPAFNNINIKDFIYLLDIVEKFYSSQEQYEKCAFILNLKNFVKDLKGFKG